VDQRPGSDELNANTSLRAGDERNETAEGVDASGAHQAVHDDDVGA